MKSYRIEVATLEVIKQFGILNVEVENKDELHEKIREDLAFGLLDVTNTEYSDLESLTKEEKIALDNDSYMIKSITETSSKDIKNDNCYETAMVLIYENTMQNLKIAENVKGEIIHDFDQHPDFAMLEGDDFRVYPLEEFMDEVNNGRKDFLRTAIITHIKVDFSTF